MTEQDWPTSTDVAAMLEEMQFDERRTPPYRGLSDRKLRLFACGLCRQVWDGKPCPEIAKRGDGRLCGSNCPGCRGTDSIGGLSDPRSRHAVEVAEKYADGEATKEEYRKVIEDEGATPRTPENDLAWWTCGAEVNVLARRAAEFPLVPPATQAALLRCVVGNPFDPVLLPCKDYPRGCRCPMCHPWRKWRTSTVLALVRTAYEDRDWALLPILADALDEAGMPLTVEQPCPTCEQYRNDPENLYGPGHHPERDPASGRHEGAWTNCKRCSAGGESMIRPGIVRVPHPLLAHLRGPGPHCRGCHVVDALLEKE